MLITGGSVTPRLLGRLGASGAAGELSRSKRRDIQDHIIDAMVPCELLRMDRRGARSQFSLAIVAKKTLDVFLDIVGIKLVVMHAMLEIVSDIPSAEIVLGPVAKQIALVCECVH